MAITPVEMLSLAPKSQEASFLKTAEVQKPVHEQVALGQHMQTETMRKSERTEQVKHAENPEYRYNASEGGSNGFLYQKNSGKKHNKNENPKEQDKKPVSGFDVKI